MRADDAVDGASVLRFDDVGFVGLGDRLVRHQDVVEQQIGGAASDGFEIGSDLVSDAVE